MRSAFLPSLFAGAQLLGSALALPHAREVIQEKRGAPAIVTATFWQTVQAPDVIVIVDENGKPVATNRGPAPTPAPVANPAPKQPAAAPAQPSPAPAAPAPAAPAPKPIASAPASKPVAPAPAPAAPPAVKAPPGPPPAPAAPASVPAPPRPAPAPAAPAPAPPAPAPEAGATEVNNLALAEDNGFIDNTPSGFGISWSGYKGGENDATCKTFEDADREWSQMGAYGIVRVYGTDCDQPKIAMQLAEKYNKKVFLGAYYLDDRLPQQLGAIIDAVKSSPKSWRAVDTISIGNEDVHRGEKNANQIVGYIGQARSILRRAGYRGAIVHVDTQDAILKNPVLCSHRAGDYIAANVHPFFGRIAANQAGDFVAGQVDMLKSCGAKHHRRARHVRVRVTETGWPKDGVVNGEAVPGKAFQDAALASIRKRFSTNVIMFSAFNNAWMKNDASTFNTEHYWGMLDN